MKIALCDDEKPFLLWFKKKLEKHVPAVQADEFIIDLYSDGRSLLKAQAKQKYNVIFLDIHMPGIDGMQVCKKIREKSNTIGIIMLSAKSQEMDKISCLMSGADDYITKPFSISELIARVDAVCRRVNRSGSKPEEASQIVSGPFTLNLKSRTVFKNGEQIDLTQVEYQIMEYFFKNQNTALDRSSILNHIWGESYYGDDKIVDVNIRRIRMKIEDEPSNPKYILTIWGFGYKWAGGSN